MNFSIFAQTHGYYDFTSDLASFERPTAMANLGVAASHRFGPWELSMAAEATHLRMASADDAIRLTPATLASASVTGRRSGVLFSSADRHDSLALSLTLPPRAIAGSFDLNYMTRTPDGLGQQVAHQNISLGRLTREPVRLESAYQLVSGSRLSFSLAGGVGLGSGAEQQLMGSFGWRFQ